jgi:hypothetical protein
MLILSNDNVIWFYVMSIDWAGEMINLQFWSDLRLDTLRECYKSNMLHRTLIMLQVAIVMQVLERRLKELI